MKIQKFDRPIPAKMSGVENEGDYKGCLVCPTINLWGINRRGKRVRVLNRVPHDLPVIIVRQREGILGETLYYVKGKKDRGLRGWVTERFVIKEDSPH